jgi:hypothetical protein
LPGEGFKRPWPPLLKIDEAVKAKVENCCLALGNEEDFQVEIRIRYWRCLLL